MGKTVALNRVAADLSRGLTHPAIQRLSSLVAAHPTDLDLRRRLAAAHRRVGNRIQAGRWDYLTIGADTADTSAFERAFPSATARLRAVHWPQRASAAATSYARGRLAKLFAAAEAEAGIPSPPVPVPAGRRRSLAGSWLRRLPAHGALRPARPAGWRSAGLLVAGAAAAMLVGVGVVTVLEWLARSFIL